jgi:hypothetical protein
MSDDREKFEQHIRAMLSDPGYLQTLLGVAISRLPDATLEVTRADYENLEGKGVHMSKGSRPDTFKLVLKELPPEEETSDIPTVGIVGEA